MVDDKEIEKIREKIKKTIKEQPMFIDNEPEFSGNPINTIQKDLEEQEQDNEERDRK